MSRPAGTFRLLSSVLMALALILSAAAWGAHSVTHGMALASAGAGQSHAGVPAPDRTAPDRDRQDGGHDHQLSLFFPVAALFGETPLDPPPPTAATAPSVEVATLTLRAGEPPPDHPPRTA
jgi:hypothetical protein